MYGTSCGVEGLTTGMKEESHSLIEEYLGVTSLTLPSVNESDTVLVQERSEYISVLELTAVMLALHALQNRLKKGNTALIVKHFDNSVLHHQAGRHNFLF